MKISRKKIYELTIIIYLICLPLSTMKIEGMGSLLKIIAIIPIVIGLSNGKLRINNLLKWQIFFSLFALISIIWSVNKENSIERALSYLELLALLISGTSFDFTEKELNNIKKALVWSSRITALILLKYGQIFSGRLWLKGVIAEDPNYICTYFSFGIIHSLQKIVETQKTNKKILSILELMFYFYLIFMSGSRGGLIAMATGVVLYLLANIGKTNIRKSIKIVVVFLVLILLCFSIIDYLPQELKNRFTIADVMRNGGTGRTEIWLNGLNLYRTSSIFRCILGYGTATTRYCFEIFGYSIVNVMHNMFLEILLELGIVGFTIYTTTIWNFVKKSLIIKDKFTFAILISMITMSLTTSISTFKPYFNIMLFEIIAYNSINCIRKTTETMEEK